MKIIYTIFISFLLQSPKVSSLLPGCVTPPMQCPNKNITFWLYTRETQDDPHELKIMEPSSFEEAPFKPNAPYIILIHGYTGWKDYAPNPEIRPYYFEYGEFNVISVDYNPIAREPCYIEAARNVKLVGKCLAQVIDYMVTIREVPLSSFHVIGFSLGAQVAGELANWLQCGVLPRITGLDPALPLFVTLERDKKLDKSDATFVDVMHTNVLRRGKLESCGHVDFFVNGGLTQPGCENNDDNMTEGSCSHWRAPVYYGESINSKVGFYGRRCQSWLAYHLGQCNFDENTEEMIMGMHTPHTAEGVFFVDTNSEPPYAKGRSNKTEEKSAPRQADEEKKTDQEREKESEDPKVFETSGGEESS